MCRDFFCEALKDFDSDILWATMCTSREAAQHEIAHCQLQAHKEQKRFPVALDLTKAKFLMTVSTSSGKSRSEQDL